MATKRTALQSMGEATMLSAEALCESIEEEPNPTQSTLEQLCNEARMNRIIAQAVEDTLCGMLENEPPPPTEEPPMEAP